jgi:hypothetical protein
LPSLSPSAPLSTGAAAAAAAAAAGEAVGRKEKGQYTTLLSDCIVALEPGVPVPEHSGVGFEEGGEGEEPDWHRAHRQAMSAECRWAYCPLLLLFSFFLPRSFCLVCLPR